MHHPDDYTVVIGAPKSAPEDTAPSETAPAAEAPEEKKRRSVLVDIAKFAIVALIIVTPFRFYVAQPFIVAGSSMKPTFEPDEYLVVDELSYRFDEPQRGDIVIFKYPMDPSTFFIKRIVGLPGETIEIRNGEVYAHGTNEPALPEPYRSTDDRGKEELIKLQDDEYYVLGDNRAASSDSRVWGPLNERYIIGRAFARLLPLSNFDIFPGKYDFEGEQ
jgi:signal peptidase I